MLSSDGSERYARLFGRRGLGVMTSPEVLEELRALRRRHAAVAALIGAFERARAAGCDFSLVGCAGCEYAPPRLRRRAT